MRGFLVSSTIGIVGVAAALAWASPLRAQVVRGMVVTSEPSHAPIASAAVQLFDEAGNRVAGTFSDDGGRFAMIAPVAGTYSVRVERIGFRGATSAITVREGETVAPRVTMTPAPTAFAPVTIAATARCTLRPDEGSAVSAAWQQARTALLAAQLTQEEQLLKYRARRYWRDIAVYHGGVLRSKVSLDSSVTSVPYVTAPAEALARRGYVWSGIDSITYFAPDASVLMSNEFAATHCLRLVRGERSHAVDVGIGFEPIRDSIREGHTEVAGVLWLDAKSGELKTLDFRYLPQPIEGADRIGGSMAFHHLPNGASYVSRWWIRMPVTQLFESPHLGDLRELTREQLQAIHEVGGEVIDVRTLDGRVIGAPVPPTVLAGVLFDSTRGVPLVGADVTLEGADLDARSDASGRFEIRGPLEGRYHLHVRHPALARIGYAPRMDVTLKRGERTEINASVPSVHTLLGVVCPARGSDNSAALVTGIVIDGKTLAPIAEAAVSIEWPLAATTPSSATGGAGVFRRLQATTDSTGRYRFCSVPPERVLSIHAVAPDGREGDTKTKVAANELAVRDLAIAPRKE